MKLLCFFAILSAFAIITGLPVQGPESRSAIAEAFSNDEARPHTSHLTSFSFQSLRPRELVPPSDSPTSNSTLVAQNYDTPYPTVGIEHRLIITLIVLCSFFGLFIIGTLMICYLTWCKRRHSRWCWWKNGHDLGSTDGIAQRWIDSRWPKSIKFWFLFGVWWDIRHFLKWWGALLELLRQSTTFMYADFCWMLVSSVRMEWKRNLNRTTTISLYCIFCVQNTMANGSRDTAVILQLVMHRPSQFTTTRWLWKSQSLFNGSYSVQPENIWNLLLKPRYWGSDISVIRPHPFSLLVPSTYTNPNPVVSPRHPNRPIKIVVWLPVRFAV